MLDNFWLDIPHLQRISFTGVLFMRKNARNKKKNVENIKMTKFEAPGRMKFYNGLINFLKD